MEQVGYGQYIADNIRSFPFGVPIYTDKIAHEVARQFQIELYQAKILVNVNLKRIADNNGLERYQKGIYYKAQETPFGKTKLNPVQIMRDLYLVKDGQSIGYETGPSFFNRIGLTTQLSKYKTYATNAFRQKGNRVEEKLGVILRKPPAEVTNDNCRYLQLLDVIENKEKLTMDALEPDQILLEYIQKNELDYVRLAGYASQYYRKEVSLRLGELASIMLK
ncbi:MAG TPA: hypothetical protein GXX75_22680 [Clostridiales bacterium]|nr:hypothetical protein [Clostridiales bacterium]